MLRKSYNWIINYASRPSATYILALVSFVESSFFPIPPDPLYIAMLVANREKAWRLAILCTLTSVVGGVLGYYIGYALYESIGVWIIENYHMEAAFEKLQRDFNEWGFWIIALKGLTPIPYKIVTISSGVARLDMTTFIIASIIARGFRFFSLAGLIYYFGPGVRDYLDKNLGFVTTVSFLALIGGFIIFKYLSEISAFFSSFF
tara:strand:+ start:7082 stop:7693 length:612 start_codon:yes stop_codon:yes gene_type:complete